MELLLLVLMLFVLGLAIKTFHDRSKISRFGREFKTITEFLRGLEAETVNRGMPPPVLDQDVTAKWGHSKTTVFGSWREDPINPDTEYARVWMDSEEQLMRFLSPDMPDAIVATRKPASRRRYQPPADEVRNTRFMLYLTAIMLAWNLRNDMRSAKPPSREAEVKDAVPVPPDDDVDQGPPPNWTHGARFQDEDEDEGEPTVLHSS